MSNHQRLSHDQFQARLRNLTDTTYQEFVVPNPFMPPSLVPYNEYRQFVDLLVESYFDFLPPSNLVVPPANPIIPHATVPPVPAPTAAPRGPELHPNFERAVRCASITLSTGDRCARAAFHPYTLCSVHYRYFKVHNMLPPGGAVGPGRPHPQDAWPAPKPPRV